MIGGHCRDTTLKRRLVSGGIYIVTRTYYRDLLFDTYNTGLLLPSESQVCGFLPIHDTHLYSGIISNMQQKNEIGKWQTGSDKN